MSFTPSVKHETDPAANSGQGSARADFSTTKNPQADAGAVGADLRPKRAIRPWQEWFRPFIKNRATGKSRGICTGGDIPCRSHRLTGPSQARVVMPGSAPAFVTFSPTTAPARNRRAEDCTDRARDAASGTGALGVVVIFSTVRSVLVSMRPFFGTPVGMRGNSNSHRIAET